MFSFQKTGTSNSSASDALSAALGMAPSSISGAVSTHIIVNSISKTSEGWIAIVTVVVELKQQEKLEPSDIKETPEKTEQAKEEQEAKEKAQRLLEKAAHNAGLIYEEELEQQQRRIEQNRERTLLYIEHTHEEIFREIEEQFHFDSVHIMAEGPLWETANKTFPDIEMYEAAHNNDAKTENVSPDFEKSPKPTRHPDLSEELIDE